MKKIIFISALAILAVACHKEPYPQDSDNEYLVYTAPDKDIDFTKFTTFDIPDSLLIIGKKRVLRLFLSAMILLRRYTLVIRRRRVNTSEFVLYHTNFRKRQVKQNCWS